MVIGPAIRAGIRLASLYSRQTVNIDYKLLRKAGYKRAAARGISHGIFTGSIGNYLKDDNGIEPDGQIQKPYGTSSNKQNKARGGQFSYSKRSRSDFFHSCPSNRRSYFSKYKWRRNR